MSLKGKVIVVTGGFGALGSAVAEVAAAQGASVIALDYSPNAPGSLSPRLGGDALVLGGVDLSITRSAERAMAEITTRFKRIDVLLNIAGGFRWERFADASNVDTWDRMFAINLKTALNAARAAIPYFLEAGAGRIVNVGALAANRAKHSFTL